MTSAAGMVQIWGVVAPVLASVAVGYVWGRSGRRYDTDMVSRLVMNVGAPCLIVATLGRVALSPGALGRVALVWLLVVSITALLAWLYLRLSGKPARVYFPSLVFPNVGNMGLPICLLAFGQHGLALALAWFMITSVAQFSLGQSVASGNTPWRELWRNPVVLSVFVAVAMVAGHWSLPRWLFNTLNLLGGLTIPLMLVTLGVSLSGLHVRHLRPALLFSLLRLGGGFGIAWGVCALLNVHGTLRGVVLVQSSMPVAVFNYLFALRYRQGDGEVAGMVVMSTLLAFLMLPLLLAYLLPAG